MREQINQLINDQGKTVTFRREVKSAYTPGNSQVPAVTNDDEGGIGFFNQYKDSAIDGSLVQMGDRIFYLSIYGPDGTALSKKPMIDDTIIDGSEQMKVVSVRTYEDRGTVYAYKLQVRS